MLKKELSIFTFGDLLEHFPLRHIDKTTVNAIADISSETDFVQVAGTLEDITIIGEKRSKRLVARIRDKSGVLELCWFQGINWIEKNINAGKPYLVFGKAGFFNGKPQITHPEIELWSPAMADGKNFLEPVYPTTEKLKSKGLNGKQIGKLTATLMEMISAKEIQENLPAPIISKLELI